jgi:hypothetical protein
MTRNTFIIACAFAGIASFASTLHAQQRPSASYSDRYSVLSERNIFLKDRSQPSTRPTAATRPSPSDPERSNVLRGIVVEEDGYRAYVENNTIGTVSRLAVGDPIARGKITAIDIDAIAYETPTGNAWIAIGHDFTGQQAAASSGEASISSAASSTPTTTPAGLEGLNPNDPNLTVEQKLKLRRLQEQRGR